MRRFEMNDLHSQSPIPSWKSLSKFLSAFLLLGICSSCCQREEPTAETEPLPNIVLILADDMGTGDVGVYNPSSKAPTPNLDSLAASGVRFTDAHSASGVCTPTRYALLTGRYSWRTHMKKGVLKGYSPLLINPARSTIASMLREQGYTTAAIGKWHLGLGDNEVTDYARPLSPGPNDVGFDYFFGIPASLDMPPYTFVEDDRIYTSFDGDEVGESARRRDGGEGYWHAGPIARDFTHEGVPKSGNNQPFFLYVPLNAPHTPWMPTAEFIGRSDLGYYGDFIVQVDDTVGQIINALDETGIAKNTIIVFASDNGARWAPEDTARWDHRANMHYRGQKADIFEGGHRVPMIVSWPGQVEANTQTTYLAGLTDLYATIADVVGAKPGAEDGVDSETILPTLLGETQVRGDAVIHHSAAGMFAVRSGDWKLIEGLGSGGFTQPKVIEPEDGGPVGQLYNLAEDPSETTNLYLQRPDVVERLAGFLEEIRGTDSGPL
jgi:arylsulfatase A-like enzyme